jgi:hypothetical protein
MMAVVGDDASASTVGVAGRSTPANPVAKHNTPENITKMIAHKNSRHPRCPALRRRRQYRSVRLLRNERTESSKNTSAKKISSAAMAGTTDRIRSAENGKQEPSESGGHYNT